MLSRVMQETDHGAICLEIDSLWGVLNAFTNIYGSCFSYENLFRLLEIEDVLKKKFSRDGKRCNKTTPEPDSARQIQK